MQSEEARRTVPYRQLARVLQRTARLALMLVLAAGLSGCMEALQSGSATGVTPFAPPAPRPTQTAPARSPEPTAQLTASPAPETPSTATEEPGAPTAAQPTQEPTAAQPTQEQPTQEQPTLPPALPTLALPTLPPVSNEERWRAQQEGREVFPEAQGYSTTGSELLWFDPVNQQSVTLGVITGGFSAQARFVLRGSGAEALEVPYQVNRSYGLTALSPAILERIRAAGYGEWIETYVVITPNVSSR